MKGRQANIIKWEEAKTNMGTEGRLDILRLWKGKTCLVGKKFKKKKKKGMNVNGTTKKTMVTVWVILNLI